MSGGPIAKVAAYPVPSAAVGHAYTNEHYDQHHHHQQQHLDYTPTSVHKTVEHAVPVKSTFYTSAAPTPVHHYSAGEKHIHTVPSQTLAIVPAHHKQPAVYESHGHTHESVMRDHDGTVSHYGKTLSTPHSHVHKEDTRIVKDQYYASPVVAHPAPVHHYSTVAAPVVHHQYKAVAPVAADVHHYSHEAPAAVHQYSNAGHQQHVHEYTQAAPAPVVHHHHQYEEPHHQYSHAAPHQYANSAPVVAHKSVSYSPAEAVAQVSFKSADAHYSW